MTHNENGTKCVITVYRTYVCYETLSQRKTELYGKQINHTSLRIRYNTVFIKNYAL